MMDWRRHEEWGTTYDPKKGCNVTVKHWEAQGDAMSGRHRWAVYAILTPAHPLYAQIDATKYGQPALDGMPLHGGPLGCVTHLRDKPADAKGIYLPVIEVGADYDHIDDDRFRRMATREEAAEVFRDAERLYEWLAEYADREPATETERAAK